MTTIITTEGNKEFIIPAKCPKASACKCPFKYKQLFSNEVRSEICRSFYDLGNYTRQKDFIAAYFDEHIADFNLSRKRKVPRAYYLPYCGQRKRVCSDFCS